jgi:hypothetical protein
MKMKLPQLLSTWQVYQSGSQWEYIHGILNVPPQKNQVELGKVNETTKL